MALEGLVAVGSIENIYIIFSNKGDRNSNTDPLGQHVATLTVYESRLLVLYTLSSNLAGMQWPYVKICRRRVARR